MNIFSSVEELKERALQRYNKVRVSTDYCLYWCVQAYMSPAQIPSPLFCCSRAQLQNVWCLAQMISLCFCGTLLKTRSLWRGWLAIVRSSMKCCFPQTPGCSPLPHLTSQLKSGMDALESKKPPQLFQVTNLHFFLLRWSSINLCVILSLSRWWCCRLWTCVPLCTYICTCLSPWIKVSNVSSWPCGICLPSGVVCRQQAAGQRQQRQHAESLGHQDRKA